MTAAMVACRARSSLGSGAPAVSALAPVKERLGGARRRSVGVQGGDDAGAGHQDVGHGEVPWLVLGTKVSWKLSRTVWRQYCPEPGPVSMSTSNSTLMVAVRAVAG